MEEERYYYVDEIKKIDKSINGLNVATTSELLLGSTLLIGGLILRDENMIISSLVSLSPVLPNLIAKHNLINKRKENFEHMVNAWSDYPELIFRIESGSFDTKKHALNNLLEQDYSYEEISRRTKIPVEELYDINDIPSADRLRELESKYAKEEDCISGLKEDEITELNKYKSMIKDVDEQIRKMVFTHMEYTPKEETMLKVLTAKKAALEEQYRTIRNKGLDVYVTRKVNEYKKNTMRMVL